MYIVTETMQPFNRHGFNVVQALSISFIVQYTLKCKFILNNEKYKNLCKIHNFTYQYIDLCTYCELH